ncbi:MAG: hypothetical protein GXO81_10060 [Chlorobi bacterium]|nr:hypothetical protein [Chlorobiota bacterium]
MDTINIKRFGLAFGLTGIILYAGCILVMFTVGRNGTILFFNSLLHGLDTSSIIRMDIQVSEVIIGIIETFIISWLIGACIAMFYNISLKKNKK